MAHMQPYVEFGLYFSVETSHGTEIIPADVIGRTCGTAAEAFSNYVDGRILDPDECVDCREGWMARLSAPGYMDCTEWSVHSTEAEAREYLTDMYGDDDEN